MWDTKGKPKHFLMLVIKRAILKVDQIIFALLPQTLSWQPAASLVDELELFHLFSFF